MRCAFDDPDESYEMQLQLTHWHESTVFGLEGTHLSVVAILAKQYQKRAFPEAQLKT